VIIVGVDQLLKAWVRANLWDPPRTIVVIPSWLELTPVANRGVAFGLFQEAGPLLGLLVVGTFAVLAVRKWRALLAASPLMKVTMGLIAGGAIGNLIDRAYQGYVIDFLTVPRIWIFQVFNIADAAISVGTVLLFLAVWLPRPRRSETEPARAETAAPPESASDPVS
jgi:signal peptidase II